MSYVYAHNLINTPPAPGPRFSECKQCSDDRILVTCGFSIVVAFGYNKLWWTKDTNSPSVTFQMMLPLATTNCSSRWLQKMVIKWYFGHSEAELPYYFAISCVGHFWVNSSYYALASPLLRCVFFVYVYADKYSPFSHDWISTPLIPLCFLSVNRSYLILLTTTLFSKC